MSRYLPEPAVRSLVALGLAEVIGTTVDGLSVYRMTERGCRVADLMLDLPPGTCEAAERTAHP